MSEEMNSLPNDEQQPNSKPCQLISTMMHGRGELLIGAFLYSDGTMCLCQSTAEYVHVVTVPFSFIEAVHKQMQAIREGKVCAAR